ncbi:hypothetical protein PH5382_01006 [Phaeobacter sp. CECT 5382]|uniref:hypothetical protein n=1 Tax=Phaeobacter sp. CECT 5382 TaxID=1712645 RepID=UPI0006DA1797|nr:hypothetical protein [Phaeobacter sp. CECT 5382]CUH87085.1 hypothetical protein PH5382_01006 [Phaeobacter sp. CECT 5382]
MTTIKKPAGLSSAAPLCCPQCSVEFHPKRKDKKYCSSKCAKAATRNASRGGRSFEQKVTNEVHYCRARDLADMLYTAPVTARLGIMKAILDAASDHDSGLRRILTDPTFLKASPETPHLFHRRAPSSYKTISQAANAYTQKFHGISIQTYLKDARSGALKEHHEVSRKVDYGAVPVLTKIRKPKCWHRPLSDDKNMEASEQLASDMERVQRIVDDAQARAEGLLEAA